MATVRKSAGSRQNRCARQQRVPEQRRQERRQREVQIREGPQRERVVVGQLAARLPEVERVDGRRADDARHADRRAAPDHPS